MVFIVFKKSRSINGPEKTISIYSKVAGILCDHFQTEACYVSQKVKTQDLKRMLSLQDIPAISKRKASIHLILNIISW